MKTATSNLRLHAYCHFKVKEPLTFLSSFFIIFFKMNFSFGFELNNDVHLKMWSMQSMDWAGIERVCVRQEKVFVLKHDHCGESSLMSRQPMID